MGELNKVEIQVIWTDQDRNPINMTTGDLSVGSGLYANMLMDTNTFSLDLNFNNLQNTQVGRYTCCSTFSEWDSEPFILQDSLLCLYKVSTQIIRFL